MKKEICHSLKLRSSSLSVNSLALINIGSYSDGYFIKFEGGDLSSDIAQFSDSLNDVLIVPEKTRVWKKDYESKGSILKTVVCVE